jgi:hypothetical protein
MGYHACWVPALPAVILSGVPLPPTTPLSVWPVPCTAGNLSHRQVCQYSTKVLPQTGVPLQHGGATYRLRNRGRNDTRCKTRTRAKRVVCHVRVRARCAFRIASFWCVEKWVAKLLKAHHDVTNRTDVYNLLTSCAQAMLLVQNSLLLVSSRMFSQIVCPSKQSMGLLRAPMELRFC